jgi:hypothetical protein
MGIFNLGGSGNGTPVVAANVSFDNDASGLDATDAQAAIDEVVAEKLDVPGFVLWEAVDWVTLITDTGAPSSATGGPGWYYLDITSGSEELYGPASFDPTIPGWDWGSPLANFVFSTDGPTDEAGDWYVHDDSGTYILFQKKTQINYGDMLFWDGADWEARSQKIAAQDVYADLSGIDTAYGVDAVATQLQNLFSNYATAYNGGNGFLVEDNITGTYEINPFDGNAFVLTVTGNVSITFATNWDPTSQLGTRFCSITVVLKQDGTGGHSVTWPANAEFQGSGGNESTGANHVGIWQFMSWDNGTTWYGHAAGNNYN